MSEPLPPHTITLLRAAIEDAKGAHLKTRADRIAARLAELRGFGTLNKSKTRLHIRPAGRFVVDAIPVKEAAECPRST